VSAGWGTWAASFPARLVHPARGLALGLGVYGTSANAYSDLPYDPERLRLGPRLPGGRFLELEAAHAGARVRLRAAVLGEDELVGEVRVLETGEWGLRVWWVLWFGGEDATVTLEGAGDYERPPVARAGELAFGPRRRPVGAHLYDRREDVGEELEGCGYYFRPPPRATGRFAVLRFNAVEPREVFAVARREALPGALAGADAALEDARARAHAAPPRPAAVRDVLAWNTVWDATRGVPYTAATRAWVDRRFGGTIVWQVDAFAHVLLAGHVGDLALARANLDAALAGATPAGNLAALRSPLTLWADRSHPPLGALALWDLHARTGDAALLRDALPVLTRAWRWWFAHRDGDGDGLLEHGSSPVGDGHFVHTRLAALDESAMDNGPQHDEAGFRADTHTLDTADVGLNALLVLEGELLAELQGGDAELSAGAAALRERVRERLWDPERRVFANRRWDGRFARSLAPTSFYPLLAAIATPEQAHALVHEHLLRGFWGALPVAGTPHDDPAAADNVYWRGRVWAILNLLVYRGLRRAGFDREAAEVAERGLAVFERHWADRRCYENLNQITGEGADSPDADPFYTWGALLAVLPDLEVIDRTPWHGLEVGAPGTRTASAELCTAAGPWRCDLDGRTTRLVAPDGAALTLHARLRARHVRREGTGFALTLPARDAPLAAEAGGARVELAPGPAGEVLVAPGDG
jgi:putative isomerase